MSNKEDILAFERILIIVSKQFFVFWEYILGSINVLFSKRSIGKIHLFKKNFPTKELTSYYDKVLNFLDIKTLIILHMQRIGYGNVIILLTIDCISSSTVLLIYIKFSL